MINEIGHQPQGPPASPGTVVRPASVTTSAGVGAPSVGFAPGAHYLLHLTPEAADELNQLIAQTGDSPAELFRRAIGLYKVAKQAIQEGKAVGIAQTADSLESQFVGI